MIDTNNSKIGNPFPFRVFCQKVIPLAFDESLSYLELLYSLLHYIKEIIIPAVNNNADAVEELQNLYNELKSYVDNYFENLDVQEEINNKLDEMAESGQLTHIIAQYLELAGVLAYDTVDDLKSADNLTNGSIAKTLGYSNIQDTNGAFYKIRNVLNTDVIDNINIIALNNFENLVAEKIKEKQSKISYKPTYLDDDYYFTISYHENRHFLYISKDGINWQKVFEIPRNVFMEDCPFPFDFSCIVDDGYFYLTYDYVNSNYNGWNELNPDLFRGGNRVGIARTKNFIDWEKWNLPIDLQYKQTFAPEFFIDEDNTHYINISLSTTEIKTDSSNVSNYFKKNYIIRTDNEFKNIVSVTNNLPVNFVNIDGSIFKDNNIYYLSVKDEETKTIKIYSSNNILSFTNLSSEVKMINKQGNIQGVEAPSIIKINNYYVLFVDVYSLQNLTAIFVSQDMINWSNSNLLNTPDKMSHFTPVKTNAESRNLLNIAYSIFNYPDLTLKNNINGMINEISTSNNFSLFVPLPNSTYIFYGGNLLRLTPINLFFNNEKNKDFKIINGSDVGGRDIFVNINENEKYIITGKSAQIFGFEFNSQYLIAYGSSISPTEFSLTVGSNITINYQHCKRIGKIINLNVSFTPSANISWYDLLFSNVPAVTDALQFPIIDRNDANQETKWAYVQASGEIQAQRDFTSGHNYRFNVTYICN